MSGHPLFAPHRVRLSIIGAFACVMTVLALSTSVLAADSGIGRFLVRPGEEPGFKVGMRLSTSNLRVYLKGDPNLKADIKRYKELGFVAGAEEQLVGRNHAQAGSGAVQLRTVAEAERLQFVNVAVIRHQGPGVYRRIEVPGVPNAVGFAFTGAAKNGGLKNRDANVYWVQGSCLLFVGDLRPGRGRLARPVIHAVRAIHRRTGGRCP